MVRGIPPLTTTEFEIKEFWPTWLVGVGDGFVQDKSCEIGLLGSCGGGQ